MKHRERDVEIAAKSFLSLRNNKHSAVVEYILTNVSSSPVYGYRRVVRYKFDTSRKNVYKKTVFVICAI